MALPDLSSSANNEETVTDIHRFPIPVFSQSARHVLALVSEALGAGEALRSVHVKCGSVINLCGGL